MIANSVKKNKVKSFVHVSALNVNKIRNSYYANSKYLGEKDYKRNFSVSSYN